MVPFEIKQYYEDETEQEKKVLYFVSEGTNSEDSFFEHLFQIGSQFIIPSKYKIGVVSKTGYEKGVSNPITLVKFVIQWAENNLDFNMDNSKIFIFFDLDNQSNDDINTLINLKTDYIEYGFSNPKFEVIQLLSIYSDLTPFIADYNDKGFPNRVLENAFSTKSHHNSKTRASGLYISNRIETILKNRSYDESDITKAKSKFCTNVINILCDIKSGRI